MDDDRPVIETVPVELTQHRNGGPFLTLSVPAELDRFWQASLAEGRPIQVGTVDTVCQEDSTPQKVTIGLGPGDSFTAQLRPPMILQNGKGAIASIDKGPSRKLSAMGPVIKELRLKTVPRDRIPTEPVVEVTSTIIDTNQAFKKHDGEREFLKDGSIAAFRLGSGDVPATATVVDTGVEPSVTQTRQRRVRSSDADLDRRLRSLFSKPDASWAMDELERALAAMNDNTFETRDHLKARLQRLARNDPADKRWRLRAEYAVGVRSVKDEEGE